MNDVPLSSPGQNCDDCFVVERCVCICQIECQQINCVVYITSYLRQNNANKIIKLNNLYRIIGGVSELNIIVYTSLTKKNLNIKRKNIILYYWQVLVLTCFRRTWLSVSLVGCYQRRDTARTSKRWRVAENLDRRKMSPGQGTFHILCVWGSVCGYSAAERATHCNLFWINENNFSLLSSFFCVIIFNLK